MAHLEVGRAAQKVLDEDLVCVFCKHHRQDADDVLEPTHGMARSCEISSDLSIRAIILKRERVSYPNFKRRIFRLD